MKDSDELPLSEPRSVRYILPGEGLLVAESDDDLPPSGLPGGSVRYIFPREGPLVADIDDDLPLSGLPGGSVSVRYSIPGERVLLGDSDNDLPLREPPGGSVRYIIPGEGPLVEDYCIKILHWSRSSGYKAKYILGIN